MFADPERDAVWKGAAFMVLCTVALFFVPAVGGLAGGLLGGWRAGDWRRALRAAGPAALLSAVGVGLLLAVVPLPGFGQLSRVAITMWLVVTVVALLFGALIGGLGAHGDARRSHAHAA